MTLEGLLLGLLVVSAGSDAGPLQTSLPEVEQAQALIEESLLEEAIELLRETLPRAEGRFGAASLEVGEVANQLVVALLHAGRRTDGETLRLARRAVDIRERQLGPDDPETLESLQNLGMVLYWIGRLEPARQLLQRVLAGREAAGGTTPLDATATLNNLMAIDVELGHYDEAMELGQRSLAAREAALGRHHPDVARTLNNLSVVASRAGLYEDALEYGRRALEIREAAHGPDHRSVIASLINVAATSDTLGDYRTALRLYERAISAGERTLGPAHPDVAYALNNLGLLLQTLGRYRRSRALLERSIAVREEALGAEHRELAASLINLAALLEEIGDFDAARPLLERARVIAESAWGAESPQLASSLTALADWHLREDRELPQAAALLARAIDLQRRSEGPPSLALAHSLGLLGDLHQRRGELAAAQRSLDEAAAIQLETLGEAHPATAGTLLELARTHRAAGDSTAASEALQRAIAAYRTALGPEHPKVAEGLVELADLHLDLGDRAAAFDDALRAERIRRHHVRLTVASLPERQAIGYAALSERALDIALSIAAADPSAARTRAAWDAVIRSRALVLDELGRRRRAAVLADDPSLGGHWSRLAASRDRLAALVIRGPQGTTPEAYRRLVERATDERERRERALAEASAAFAATLSESRVEVEAVLTALPEGSALVAYARYRGPSLEPAEADDAPPRLPLEARYLAFIAAPETTEPVVVDLGAAIEIERLVAAWRERVTGYSEARYRRAGRRLREAVWDPVAAHAGVAARIFVVPDGQLQLVSFAALPRSAGGYLVEGRPTLHHLSAERDLVGVGPSAPAGSSLLVLGGVDFDRRPADTAVTAERHSDGETPPSATRRAYRGPRAACGELRSLRFTALPGALDEAREVASIWRSASRARAPRSPRSGDVLHLTGTHAAEGLVKAIAGDWDVLHLATHAFFLGEECATPASPTAGTGDGLVTRNPFLQTGLALAGANLRQDAGPQEEDGILTAEEIAALDLSGVDLAVLSSCDSGSGTVVRGEGVLGLRRAFRSAGVRSLVYSLWPVNDRTTARWMRELYSARLERGLPLPEAVQEASRAALRRLRAAGQPAHPYHWGAFVAEGAWY